jgi:hypothetical protein
MTPTNQMGIVHFSDGEIVRGHWPFTSDSPLRAHRSSLYEFSQQANHECSLSAVRESIERIVPTIRPESGGNEV